MKKKLFFILLLFACSCGNAPEAETVQATNPVTPQAPAAAIVPTAKPKIPNLQAEILDPRNKKTDSPIGAFDFKNFTFELPRGWQNPDGSTEFTLVNGHVAPFQGKTIVEDMADEEKAEIRSNRRIGMSYVTTKYLDLDGNGGDEAIVVTKIETGGSAIPQIVYVFRWNGGKPEMLWTFRTGDRADGGLKDIRYQNGMTVIELYGQDRFILGSQETGKITGDEEQLCCPTFFTRSEYKWNGNTFQLQGKRLTHSMTDPSRPPQENLGEIVNAPGYKPKK